MNRLLKGISGRVSNIPAPYQDEFASEFDRINLQSLRILTLVGFVLVPASAILDYFINPDYLLHFMVVRTAMSLCCMGLFVLSFVKRLQPYCTVLTMCSMIAVGGGIAYMIRVLGYEDPYYAGLNLVYLASMLVPWGLTNMLVSCSIVYSFYLIPILVFDLEQLDIAAFVNNNIFQVEVIIIAAVVNHFQLRRRMNEIVNRLTIAHQARELEEIDKYKREFIANVTHELKTPLAIVMGNADLIIDQTDDENMRSGIDVIRRAAFQLANHVDRIIAVSNVDDPDVRPDMGNYDYCGVVKNVFSLFESRARGDSITYALNMAPGPLVVQIDVVRIEEVLNNLIQNAFKFTPSHGIITVTVSTDGQNVFTEISDSGVGIPEYKLGKIFNRMYQADEVLSKRHGGIGLGLYICRRNVDLHGGKISAHSSQGKGTSFKFNLLLHVDQSVQVKNRSYVGEERRVDSHKRSAERRSGMDRRAEARRKNFEYQQRMGLDELAQMTFADNVRDFENQNTSKPTVLVLEDNPGMMKVIAEALHDDYNLLLASDAFEALRKLDENSTAVSLILSDIMMPGMSGFDFCEKIMRREEYQHIPVIFITALMSQADQLKGFAVGATDYIVKPYNIKILKEKVNHWISRRHYELLLKDSSDSLEERVLQISRVKDIILHEIRNPIQMILGAGAFLDRLKEMTYENASDMEKRLWNNLKLLEQGTEGLLSVMATTRQFDVKELSSRKPERLATILNEATEQTKYLLGDIRFEVDMGGMDKLNINCDKRMLIQVLVNLIRNGTEAIRERHKEKGGRIRIACELARDKSVVLKVSDDGVGMDPDMIEKLFRFRFTTKKDGNGIGLHLSKMILKLHDGSIEAHSEKGKGSTFTLSLPTYEQEELPAKSLLVG
ncbi:MAG: response regulator [Proteobacteria bacterium]|nr:response regulator [Pseudomonadota bacterium]